MLPDDYVSSSPQMLSGGWLADDRQTRPRLALFCSAQRQLVLLQSSCLGECGTWRRAFPLPTPQPSHTCEGPADRSLLYDRRSSRGSCSSFFQTTPHFRCPEAQTSVLYQHSPTDLEKHIPASP
ncbi:hypothetical protein SRHO_G00318740 [Serrasalmus rhombeus]